jgi:hypothetical protein
MSLRPVLRLSNAWRALLLRVMNYGCAQSNCCRLKALICCPEMS